MLSRMNMRATTRIALAGATALVTAVITAVVTAVVAVVITAVVAVVVAAVVTVTAQVPAVRTSEAERRYVAPQAIEQVATAPRTATLSPGYGRKFAAENTKPAVTISNPYMDPARPIFAKVEHMECTADGGLVVGGRAGFDPDGRPLGEGFWRIAADGAVTPLHTRSTNTYALRQFATCNAPFVKSNSRAAEFSLAADGRILFAATASVQALTPAGVVTRVAGSARDCDNDGTGGIKGFGDGEGGAARFNAPARPVEDPDGNIWVTDQSGCALRRIEPDGKVTTVLGADVLCDAKVPMENRPLLDEVAWDAAHAEFVTGGSRTVALPGHNLYTTVWRIKPSGEFRRVLYGTKVGKSPAVHQLDGVRALAVDAAGRIHIVSQTMDFEKKGWDALQLMRVDEVKATIVAISATKVPNHANLADRPLDGPLTLALFSYTNDICFSTGGVIYVNDDILIRRIDAAGQVTTWAF